MSEDLLMMNGQAKLPPAWRDFVDQAVETLKLEMIREWAVRQAASTRTMRTRADRLSACILDMTLAR